PPVVQNISFQAGSLWCKTLLAQNHPDRMNNTGDEAQECQQDIQPEMEAQTHFQKDSHRWEKERYHNADDVKGRFIFCRVCSSHATSIAPTDRWHAYHAG